MERKKTMAQVREHLTIPSGRPEGWTPTPGGGLSRAEAERRAEAGESNRCRVQPGKNVFQILAGNLFTLFNLLNAALAVCLALVGSYRNMLFLGVVISNTLIGTVQELRAHHTIQRLKLLNAPVCHVLRDGEELACHPDELVRGDLVVLRAGDQVPADALVVRGEGAANEALLTGESDAVSKRPEDWLLSGSYITEGRFTAQLVLVGEESYVSRLTLAARRIKRPQSGLMTSLRKLIRVVSAALVPLGIALFCKQFFFMRAPLEEAVPSTVAAMLGMIPEGLMLLTSIAMAVGVVKLGRRGTLVQELFGIETLARADVLCLDKTGTLTTGQMRLRELVPEAADEAELRRKLSRFLGAFEGAAGTLNALREAVEPGTEQPVAVLPFSSERKRSAAAFADGVTLVLGAPSFVLGDAAPPEMRSRVEALAAEGLRVLVLCEGRGTIRDGETPEMERVLGLCVLEDTLRPRVADTLRYFREQGVQVKIISGDDPRTVSTVARRAGVDGAERWCDTSALTPAQLAQAAEEYTVFGRVTPLQKKQLVEALKLNGHSVAMTGDGVNDIPALKSADCSIAIAGGADAVGQAAQLTLLEADFARMPEIVDEGRRVINNITRAASLFLVKTLYSFALTVLLLALPAAYPFMPIQLTLVSSLTIGIPTFFLALEPNHERIRGRFLETVLLHAVPGAAAVTVCALLSMLLERFGLGREVCSTLATLCAGTIGLLVLAGVCFPLTRLRACVLGVMTGAFVLACLFLGRVFYLEMLTLSQLVLLALVFACGLGVLLGVTWALRRRLRK